MNTIGTTVRLGIASLALVAAGQVHAASCRDLVAEKTFACVSNDAESPSFTLAFDSGAAQVVVEEPGSVGPLMRCFCSSSGSARRPDVERGRVVTCVDGVSADQGSFVIARIRGEKLVQGTLGFTAATSSETFPFRCTLSD